MRHGSLFSGIGGFDLAASWLNWENVFQVEWDKWCQKVLAKNFPDTLRFGDIVEFNKMLQNGKITKDSEQFRCNSSKREEKSYLGRFGEFGTRNNDGLHIKERIGRIDILTGGFPCQPFSHAGKRKGTDDSRYLWPEMLTTIRILKPAFVVGENVAGLVSMENGKTLDRILSDLANEGYTTEQFIIPACAVGAWHRRDRIWIVAHSLDSADRTIRGQGGEKESIQGECWETGLPGEFSGTSSKVRHNVADTTSKRLQRLSGTDRSRGQGRFQTTNENIQGRQYWNSEPLLGRVANGIPNRVDRLKGLGNAIVPQVAYELFKAIELLITTAKKQ